MATPPAFNARVREGGSRRNIAMTFGVEKLELCGYWLPAGEKSLKIMFIHFDRIHERDGWTDRQTDIAVLQTPH